MDVKDLQPNSHAYKEHKKEAESFNKPVERRDVGHVVVRKRGLGRRFLDLFTASDSVNVKEYIVSDIIIPTLKNGFMDVMSIILYGRPNGRSNKTGSATYVSYNNYSSEKRREPVTRPQLRSYDDLIFESRLKAQDALDSMYEILDRYGRVSIADLFFIANVTGNGYTDNQHGWTDLTGTTISSCREGYYIRFPRCIDLD